MRTGTAVTNPVEGKNHHAAKFTKALDGRKQPIRGLWKRNSRFYAQLTVFDPITGNNRVQRIPLADKQGDGHGFPNPAVPQSSLRQSKRNPPKEFTGRLLNIPSG